MTQVDMFDKVSLVKELCRLYHSSEDAMLCAMSHKQVRVSGHIVLPHHDRVWTEPQLAGRTAAMLGREVALFNGSRRVGMAAMVDDGPE